MAGPVVTQHASADTLDPRVWATRALTFDILALGVLLLSGIGLALDLYIAGYASAFSGERSADPDFRVLVKPALESLLFIVSFGWIAARLVRAGHLDVQRRR